MTKTKTATEVLSPRAFGAALGVTRQAVQEAIRSGRLSESLSKDERTGYWLIQAEKGRAEWEAWTNPDTRPKGKRPSGRPKSANKGTPSMFEQPEEKERRHEQLTHARASAERVALDAELKKLELETLRGNLVDRRQVQLEAFRLARLVRDRIQAVPDRLAAKLASMDKPAQVHETLAAELARALEALEGTGEEKP